MIKCRCSVKVKNLSVEVSNHFILKDISFQANHGEILALIGRNGAGKTTLLNTILYYERYKNFISFFDSKYEKILIPKIGYVPQKLNFDRDIPMTVFDLFAANACKSLFFFKNNFKIRNDFKNLLKKVDAESCLNKKLSDLSGGELQRVLLAFALEPIPDVLLLDEPVSAVDRRGIEVFYSLLTSLRKEYHMPVIIAIHDLICVQKYATSYILIDKEVVEIGSAKNIHKSENIKKIFGSNIF